MRGEIHRPAVNSRVCFPVFPAPGSAAPAPSAQSSPSRGFPLRLLADTSLAGPAVRSGKEEEGEERGAGVPLTNARMLFLF